MTAALAVACLLAALVAEGDSLSCMLCFSTMGTPCEAVLTKCDGTAETCITANTETIAGGQTIHMMVRGCSKFSECRSTTMSTKGMSVKYTAGCCETDGCTPVVPAVPPSSSTPNGVICRACLSESSSCYTSDTMMCTGEEKKCIRFATSTRGSVSTDVALRGCATQNMCDVGSTSQTFPGMTVTTDLACTDSSIRLQSGVFMPIVAALILLKTVF